MKRKIWRYKMSRSEEKLWNKEEMLGWRKALEACVEDEARDGGYEQYMIFDSKETMLSKGQVSKLVPVVTV